VTRAPLRDAGALPRHPRVTVEGIARAGPSRYAAANGWPPSRRDPRAGARLRPTTGCYRAHAPDLPPFGWGGILDCLPLGGGAYSIEYRAGAGPIGKVHPCADMG